MSSAKSEIAKVLAAVAICMAASAGWCSVVPGPAEATATVLVRAAYKEGSVDSSGNRVGPVATLMGWIGFFEVRREPALDRKGELAYTMFVRASTVEVHSSTGVTERAKYGKSPEEQKVFRDAMERGDFRGTILVNSRGLYRWDRERAEDKWAELASQDLVVLPVLLFPPLPEEGVPFEAGDEWRAVPESGEWRGVGLPVRCESVRVWTSGKSEVELLEEGKPSDISPSRPADSERSVQLEHRWLLKGQPLCVQECTEAEIATRETKVTIREKSMRVLSGGIPVRP
jgi:hypothetical protein